LGKVSQLCDRNRSADFITKEEIGSNKIGVGSSWHAAKPNDFLQLIAQEKLPSFGKLRFSEMCALRNFRKRWQIIARHKK
jgi:hypothetical protein